MLTILAMWWSIRIGDVVGDDDWHFYSNFDCNFIVISFCHFERGSDEDLESDIVADLIVILILSILIYDVCFYIDFDCNFDGAFNIDFNSDHCGFYKS